MEIWINDKIIALDVKIKDVFLIFMIGGTIFNRNVIGIIGLFYRKKESMATN